MCLAKWDYRLESTVRQFPDGEIQVNIEESISGKDVLYFAITCSPVMNLMILIMVDAPKRAVRNLMVMP